MRAVGAEAGRAVEGLETVGADHAIEAQGGELRGRLVAAQHHSLGVEHGHRVVHRVEGLAPLAGCGGEPLLGLALVGDVLDEALEHAGARDGFAAVDRSATLPHPPGLAGGRDDAIRAGPRRPRGDGGLDIGAQRGAIVGPHEVGVGDLRVAEQRLRRVAGQGLAARAHKTHRPLIVGDAVVGHARQVAHEGAELGLGATPVHRDPGHALADDDADDAHEHQAGQRHGRRLLGRQERRAVGDHEQRQRPHRRARLLANADPHEEQQEERAPVPRVASAADVAARDAGKGDRDQPQRGAARPARPGQAPDDRGDEHAGDPRRGQRGVALARHRGLRHERQVQQAADEQEDRSRARGKSGGDPRSERVSIPDGLDLAL